MISYISISFYDTFQRDGLSKKNISSELLLDGPTSKKRICARVLCELLVYLNEKHCSVSVFFETLDLTIRNFHSMKISKRFRDEKKESELAKRLDDRADYCLYLLQFLPLIKKAPGISF